MSLIRLGLSDIPWREVQAADLDINTLIQRLESVYQTVSGISITPDNCMQSPTVQAIVTAVARRFASLPIAVYQKSTDSAGRTKKELQPNHPIARLLSTPNDWQDRVSYWMDAASYLLRHGRFVASKSQGKTGPIRALLPIHPSLVRLEQDANWNVRAWVNGQEYPYRQLHYARNAARDGLNGDSPITDIRETVALEIAAEKFGASFFGGGGMPGVIFKLAEGFQGFKTEEAKKDFLDSFDQKFRGRGRFTAMLTPKGIEIDKAIAVENDKAQFLETRKYQRTVIAGAFGVPPHLVGDLERGTFNNVEQQSLDFTTNVILPYVRIFEAAMEADLLTQDDRNRGIIIRFNLDATLRGDFKSRQEGQEIQRRNGVINPNDWRENENLNPREDPGGEEFWDQGPSGQNMNKAATGNGGADANSTR